MTEKTPGIAPVPSPDPDRDDDATASAFAQALEDFERSTRSAGAAAQAAKDITAGMKVQGKVVSIGEDVVLLDFGGRSEGVAGTRQFRAEDGTLGIAIGDLLDLFVVEAGDQIVLASSIRAEPHAALRQLREAQAAGVPVSGRVTGLQGGGLAVDIGSVRGFCPVSQIESGFCADPSVYVGRTLEFLVTKVEDGRGGAVVSRRKLLRREEEEQAKRLLAALKVGDELEGTVARLEAFGAFVDLGGVDGLVHVSEIRHERLAHPRDALSRGEKVRVRVLRIETDKTGKSRIALSIKAGAPDPWAGVAAGFVAGARVQGVVARLTDFGAFVTLAPGLDGLVHVSEAAPHRVGHVKEVLAPGQSVEVVVLGVDPVKKRISLSIREALAASAPPPRTPAVGDAVEGRVGSIKPFGVFVDLPDFGRRISALLPREETGEPRGADLSCRFSVGQALRVEILEIKGDKLRVGLERSRTAPRDAVPPPAPAAPRDERAPETTMGLALRKAMERSGKTRKG
ncbi:MAG: hypothetical protein A2Z48_11275 [Actinobacteria bacterium RBG_19FT_COMBO_70_19]|nr:MAG: hypothetical protein A2Z48_11275 [Actinobacteria bacterium RBG_19FT_COMBO_70_19]